ncbi:hypothetical protein HN011_006430 [Eciton burchellii]|nr:hypothetical protein HN011_006430 [Eciton burchellii]
MTSSSMQKSLLRLTVLIIVSLVLMIISLKVFLFGKKLMMETRRQDDLFLDMITNISGNLNRLDAGLDEIAAQTRIARNRLQQLIALHRENLFVCAVFAEKQRQQQISGGKRIRKRK